MARPAGGPTALQPPSLITWPDTEIRAARFLFGVCNCVQCVSSLILEGKG